MKKLQLCILTDPPHIKNTNIEIFPYELILRDAMTLLYLKKRIIILK